MNLIFFLSGTLCLEVTNAPGTANALCSNLTRPVFFSTGNSPLKNVGLLLSAYVLST